MLVFDQRLVQGGFAIDDVDKVVHHAALATHDEVQVTQAHIKVDHHGFLPTQSQTRCKAGTGGGLAHAAFARSHHDNFRHLNKSLID